MTAHLQSWPPGKDKALLLTGHRCCGGRLWCWEVWFSRPFGFGSRNYFLHQGGLLCTTVFFTLLPLGIIMVEGRGQDRVWQHSTTEKATREGPASGKVALGGPGGPCCGTPQPTDGLGPHQCNPPSVTPSRPGLLAPSLQALLCGRGQPVQARNFCLIYNMPRLWPHLGSTAQHLLTWL